MLDAINVKVKYKVRGSIVEALRGVSLRLDKPLLVTIMGPSGSGKTTLLKAIAGRVPYEGSIRVMGLEVKDNRREASRLVFYLPVGEVLIGDLTVNESIELASMSNHGYNVGDLLEWLGLSGLGNRRIIELSTGERRRVELAIALIKGQVIILIDEPTVGLDEDNARRVGELLKAASRQGRLIIAATHDPILLEYSDLVYGMRNGLLHKY
ncbi:ABC transporter ATP-binding protein [Caldivirga maquilingensis]|uniref:ABC transporter related n=1 Tax=Caldivirga maquilingensis (strain ATCC 700844 / DSM 13496 / JCM 10307 / IC-167) TaxID=397948 RepID=A8MAW1_CALMQ|nr:ABC transporter ATP-binding protein [Caldivirga maquilingensis]ABW02590.1 ABC transporter related [Caldivirga maquilingensis IC-167]